VPTAPVIGGMPQVDATLSIGVPTDEDGTEQVVFTYTWQRAATADAPEEEWVTTKTSGSDPAQHAAYLVTADDIDHFIRVVIEYTDTGGAEERVITASVGPVTVITP